MEKVNKNHFSMICFDLDGTLAESKSPIDLEMVGLLSTLLKTQKVVVASGASFKQFENQFLKNFSQENESFSNLYLLPTNGAKLYEFKGEWKMVYQKNFSNSDKKRIFDAFKKSFESSGVVLPEKNYGVVVEDRDSQITFSAHGSEAPLIVKKDWDVDFKKRTKISNELKKYIPEFSIRIGGTSSIDITMQGIDKAYGIEYIMNSIGLVNEQVLYIGDALFPGGNDESIFRLGIKAEPVNSVDETKKIIKDLISLIYKI